MLLHVNLTEPKIEQFKDLLDRADSWTNLKSQNATVRTPQQSLFHNGIFLRHFELFLFYDAFV